MQILRWMCDLATWCGDVLRIEFVTMDWPAKSGIRFLKE